MTKKDINELVKYWMHASNLDFESAVDISKKAKKYVQACFFLHLSVEKALKAYVVSTSGEHAPYSHNLSLLAKKTDLEFSDSHLKLLVEINDFNMRCRYPDDSFSIYKKATKGKTEKLIDRAGALRQWIFEQLNK